MGEIQHAKRFTVMDLMFENISIPALDAHIPANREVLVEW
jgi:hypothetical protein